MVSRASLLPRLAILTAGAVFSIAGYAHSDAATAELGIGGTVRGDIARGTAETDTIGIDLESGSRLDVTFAPQYDAQVQFFDPHGAPVTLPFKNGKSGKAKGIAIAESGRYQFVVGAGSTPSGGDYKLTAKPVWEKTLVFTGADQGTFDLDMPVPGSLKALCKSGKGTDLEPTIVLQDQAGNPVAGPILPRKGKARLAKTDVANPGALRLVIAAQAGGGAFNVVVKRKLQKTALADLDVRTGPLPVSFSDDGVDKLFNSSCVACHSWAASYAGIAPRATTAYARLKSGNMPKGGRRWPLEDLALMNDWIRTGRNR